VFNRQKVDVDFILFEIKGIASLVYLFFIGVGVVIGVLVK